MHKSFGAQRWSKHNINESDSYTLSQHSWHRKLFSLSIYFEKHTKNKGLKVTSCSNLLDFQKVLCQKFAFDLFLERNKNH